MFILCPVIGSFYIWSYCVFQETLVIDIVLISHGLVSLWGYAQKLLIWQPASCAHLFCIWAHLLWFWIEDEREEWREVWWMRHRKNIFIFWIPFLKNVQNQLFPCDSLLSETKKMCLSSQLRQLLWRIGTQVMLVCDWFWGMMWGNHVFSVQLFS